MSVELQATNQTHTTHIQHRVCVICVYFKQHQHRHKQALTAKMLPSFVRSLEFLNQKPLSSLN